MCDDAYAVVVNGRTYVEMYAAQKLVRQARAETRAKVLEEAARCAEDCSVALNGTYEAIHIAAAIRALKEEK